VVTLNLNRRRFLKYAGATAAVVGASALGLDTILDQGSLHPLSQTATQIQVYSSTTTESLTASATPIQSRFPFSGVNIAYWPGYVEADTRQVIDNLASLSVNFAMFLLEVVQSDVRSSTIVNVANMAIIKQLTSYCKDKGMNVGWTPYLTTPNGDWRGNVSPSDPDKWFANYGTLLESFAEQAAQAGVDIFMLGSELQRLEMYTPKWRNIIESIRSVFKSQLSYGVNWDKVVGKEAATAVDWLGDLDIIGISGYFPLTTMNDPTVETLKQAWNNSPTSGDIVGALTDLYGTFRRKIFFSEIGYRAVRGTNKDPSLTIYQSTPNSDNAYDPQEQANCYEAFFEVFSNISWWSGVFIWNYPSSAYGEISTDYSPEGKPAETILSKWLKA
jgi:hypothetical protein